MVRDGKPEGFFYLDHRTVDHKFNIITDVHITAGNVHDSVPYIERLTRQVEKFGFEKTLEAVALDAGYQTAYICKKLHDRNIYAVIGGRAFTPVKGLFKKWRFKFEPQRNVYLCPGKQELKYSTTNREGNREYKSNPSLCSACPLLEQCTRSRNKQKVITRHVWEDSKEWVRLNRLSRIEQILVSSALSDGRAKLRGCQRAPWASLLPVARTRKCTGASAPHRNRSKHKEDRPPLGQEGLADWAIFFITQLSNS